MAAPKVDTRRDELFGQPLPADWRERVVADPRRPGPDRVRVVSADTDIAVWAIVGHLRALGDTFSAATIADAAEDFRVPITAITSALAYYLAQPGEIDALLAANAAAVSWGQIGAADLPGRGHDRAPA